MSKGVKAVLGVVAAIAIPFVAPLIAGALGASTFLSGTALGGFLSGAGGSALVGAGLGAGTAAATGQNPLIGAALGGVGGFFGGGGSLSNLFGSGAATGAATTGAATTGAATTAASTSLPTMAQGGVGLLTPASAGTGVAATGLGGAAGAAGAGAAAATPSFISSLGSSLAKAINPNSLAQLAFVMFNKREGLTAAEQAAVAETARLAASDQALFRQRVEQARALLNQGTPDPERAFATTQMAVERRLREQPGGGGELAQRQAAIEGARVGALGVAAESDRAVKARMAGLSAYPTQTPSGAATRALPIYAVADKREDEYLKNVSGVLGGQRNLFGKSVGGLFS